MVNPTHNTQNIALTTRTSQISAVGINNGSLSARNIKSIIKGKTISGSQYGTIQISSSKNLVQVTNYTLVDSNALKLYTIAYTSGYVAIEADGNRACEIYALWYE